MTTPAPRPGSSSAAPAAPTGAVARLRGSGEVAAAVPSLLGFVPGESLVVVSLRGPRSRVGLVARVDLPPVDAAPGVAAGLVAALVRALAQDGAERVVAVVWSEAAPQARGLPRADLVAQLGVGLRRRRLRLDDAVLVRRGRWWSYTCVEPDCCPPDGSPLPGDTPALRAVSAASALSGRAVLPDRAAVAASVAAPVGQDAERARAAVRDARRDLAREVGRLGRAETVPRLLAVVRAAAAEVADRPGQELPEAVVAAVALALDDVPVRDQVLRWLATPRSPALLALLLQVARRTAPPDDAGVCAALGAAAHVHGDGALALLALDRALRTEPQHGLALLLCAALEAALPPAAVRTVLAGPPRRRRGTSGGRR